MAANHPAVITYVKGSTIRSKLLQRLASSPHTPTELATIESKHISHVSRALIELRDWGLVDSTESGSREHYYKITSQGYAIAAAISLRTAK
jgi:DNA-binding transcriptional ArsR family regulator